MSTDTVYITKKCTIQYDKGGIPGEKGITVSSGPSDTNQKSSASKLHRRGIQAELDDLPFLNLKKAHNTAIPAGYFGIDKGTLTLPLSGLAIWGSGI